MIRTVIAAAVAAAVIAPVTADAGTHHKKRHVYHQHRINSAPVAMVPRVGPPWAGPNQCFTDEGYGRYSPCDGRGSR